MKLDNLFARSIGLIRLIHTSSVVPAAAAAAQQSNKSALQTLRKRTGYTFVNCRKALEQFGDDLSKAEAWLREQAQKEGWAKATKLQGRTAAQGLVGIKFQPHDGLGVLVEVNCETDFVARNGKFQELVCNIAEACAKELDMKPIDGSSYHKWSLTPERISQFKWTQGRTLGDMTALTIGQLGENIVLRRAVLVKADPRECRISGYAHSSDVTPSSSGCLLGRYGAVVIYRETPRPGTTTEPLLSPPSLDDIGRQLCQHVVGMNPQSIGSLEDAPQRPVPKEAPVQTMGEGEKEDEMYVDAPAVAHEDETRMVHQEFLADPTVTVGDVLTQNGVEVLDFVRFECGAAVAEET